DLIALLPRLDELGQEVRRVLEVSRQEHQYPVAAGVNDAIEQRPERTEVPRIEYHLHPSVPGRQSAEDLGGVVGRAIVAEDVLVVVSRQLLLDDRLDGAVTLVDVLFLVVAWRDDADEPPAVGRHRFTSVAALAGGGGRA